MRHPGSVSQQATHTGAFLLLTSAISSLNPTTGRKHNTRYLLCLEEAMNEAHSQQSSTRSRPRRRELILYTSSCIIALLLAVQLNSSRHAANKYSPQSISKVGDVIDQLNDVDAKNSSLRSSQDGEVVVERKNYQKPRVVTIVNGTALPLTNAIIPYKTL